MALPLAKKSHLMAIASAACSTTTNINNALLACLSVALNTGYRFLRRNATLTPKPIPTKIQFKRVNGDQEMSATGIQMRFPYPYKAQHSRRLADSLPKYLRARKSATGMTSVYP
jgi:hypothetical protein